MPREVDEVLEDYKDVMPPELSKRLPPKEEVDHSIKLEVGAESNDTLEYNPDKANLVADTPSRKTELTTFSMPQCFLKEKIK